MRGAAREGKKGGKSTTKTRPWKKRVWIRKCEMLKKENKSVTVSFRTASRKLIGLKPPGKRCRNQKERAMSASDSLQPTLAVNHFMP